LINKIPVISIVYDRGKYHEVLRGLAKPGDTVIEIGPHMGASTRVLSDAKRVIAVDKAAQAEAASKDFPGNAVFVKGDARFFSTIGKVLKLTKKCDLLAIDMGGGRFPDTVFKVWAVWSGVFKPRDSVIRNRGLGEFLRRAQIDDDSLPNKFEDSGWLSQCGRKTPSQLKEGMEELKNWMRKR
jgi:hypothetical protein